MKKETLNILVVNKPNYLKSSGELRKHEISNGFKDYFNLIFHETDGDTFRNSYDHSDSTIDLIIISGCYIHNANKDALIDLIRIFKENYIYKCVVATSNNYLTVAKELGFYSALAPDSGNFWEHLAIHIKKGTAQFATFTTTVADLENTLVN